MVIHDTTLILFTHIMIIFVQSKYVTEYYVDLFTSPIIFVLLMHVTDCIIIRYARHVLMIYFVLTSHSNSF
jgi:hypothetical protein